MYIRLKMSGTKMSSHHQLALMVLLLIHLVHIPFVSSVGWELFEDAEMRKAVLKRAGGHEWCYLKPDCKQGASDSPWEQNTCKTGQKQTPINLDPNLVPSSKTIDFATAARAKYVLPTYNMTNNGHTVVVTPPENHGITFDWKGDKDRTFELVQIHFHWGPQDDIGSEHAIDGKSASMEMHMVHFNKQFPTFTAAVQSGQKDALAVIGVLLMADPRKTAPSDLAPIVDNLEKVAATGANELIASPPFNLMSFFPAKVHAFTYEGSLTTPECNEVVNWIVIRNPYFITPAEVDKFRKTVQGEGSLLTMNYRMLQNLNDRTVEIVQLS